MIYLTDKQISSLAAPELIKYYAKLKKQREILLNEIHEWVALKKKVEQVLNDHLLDAEISILDAEEDRLNSDYSINDALRWLH